MQITLVTDPTTFNSDYRAYQPMAALSRRGHGVSFNAEGEARFETARALRSDAVFVHRYADREIEQLARQLGSTGAAFVWDNDDDLSEIPAGVATATRSGGLTSQRRLQETKRILGLADLVTTPSETLAARYEELGARDVRVIENFVPDEFAVDDFNRNGDGSAVTIGWTAAGEHGYDFEMLELNSTLRDLLDADPSVRVASVGLNLRLPRDRYEHIPRVPLLELPAAIAGFDIGIAPIADISFNRARSNVKVKEYAAVGVPWLASPIGPYAGLGARQGGRLVADGVWGAALAAMVAKARDRRRLAKRAARWGRGQTISRNVDAWESALEDACRNARTRHGGR